MPTVGKIPKLGFGAGAKKYVVTGGWSLRPNTPGNPRIPTLGFGSSAGARLTLFGFVANPGAGPGPGGRVFYVYGGDVLS